MSDSIEYKGYTINIVNDECPSNPFEDWDGLPHLVTVYGSTVKQYNSADFDVENLPELNRQEIKDNLPAIKMLFNDKRSLLSILRENPYVFKLSGGNLVEDANELLRYVYDDFSDCEKLAFYGKILTFKKVPHLLTESRGYAQGDHVDMLLISNDENDTIETLQGSADLYSSWVWGDVYGFSILDSKGEELEDGACFGFYGNDNNERELASAIVNKSERPVGLLPAAREVIDTLIQHTRATRLKRVKAFILNRVPLHTRSTLLHAM